MGRTAFTRMGFEQGSAWGTEVALGANDGLWPESLDVARANLRLFEDPSLTGNPNMNKGDVGERSFEGTLVLPWRYGYGCPKLAALMLGTAETPAGGGPYTHALPFADRLTKFLTLAWSVVQNSSTTRYDSVPSAMIEEITFLAERGEPGRITARLLGCAMLRDAGTNGSSQIAALTQPDQRQPVLGTDGVVRLNAQGGGSLGSGDVLKPDMVAISIRRVLSRDWKMDSALGTQMSQPVEVDRPEIRLELGFPGLGGAGSFASDPDEFMDAFEAETEKKADVTFTLDSNNIWLFQLPRLQVVEQPPRHVPNTGRYPHRVVMRGLVATAAPTGMSGITQPVVLTVTDQLSGAYTT